MLLSDDGINWINYYEIEDNRIVNSYRLHKFNDNHPKVDGEVRCFCDSQGRSGVDIEHYKKTRVVKHYEHTHIMLRDNRIIELK